MNSKPRPRRIFRVALTGLAALLAATALAWACTPQAGITISDTLGPPGTSVTVNGTLFEAGSPVEIYWNGTSQQLATATGPSFSVTVKIPQAPVDTYTIYAVGRTANGAVAGRASASFTIPGPTPAGAGSDTESRPSAEAVAGSPRPAAGTTVGDGDARTGQTTRSAAGSEPVRAPGELRRRSDARQVAKAPAGVTTLPSGTTAFADSLATSPDAAVVARRKPTTRGAEGRGATTSERTAGGDLWSGFGADTARAILGSAPVRSETPGSMPALVVALLALGLLSAAAGLGLAGVRRHRRHARANTD